MITSRKAQIACAGALAAFALSSLPARAEEGVAMKSLLANMGIVAPERDPIRYRERAPLVLPPKLELRDPTSPDRMVINDPRWPKDADVEVKRRRAEEERKPVTYSEIRRMSDRNPRLTNEELRTGRSGGPDAQRDPRLNRGDNARDVLLLSPDELRGKAKADDVATLGVEPERRSLTEPPPGMRKPANSGRITTSSAAPRVDQQAADASPMAWLTRKFRGGEDDE